MIIGNKIYRIDTCSNSMQWAKEHLIDAPDGSVFKADTLKHARGRQGRTWQLAPGQLPITILLKPKIFNHLPKQGLTLRLNQLTMALALGILEPLQHYNVALKWPNDFILEHKKVGGMLVELVWQSEQLCAAILGFALNVNNIFEKNNPLYATATSLYANTQKQIDLDLLTSHLFTSLDTWYQTWQQEKYTKIYTAWKSNQCYVGKKLTIHDKQGNMVSGMVHDILPNGDIMISIGTKHHLIPFYIVEEVQYKE